MRRRLTCCPMGVLTWAWDKATYPGNLSASTFRAMNAAAVCGKALDESEFALHHLLTRYGQWIAEANDVPGDENFARVPPLGELRNATSVGFDAVIGTPDDLAAKVEEMEGYATHLALGLALPGI